MLREINVPEITVKVVYDPELTVQQVANALDAVLASPMTDLTFAPGAPGKR